MLITARSKLGARVRVLDPAGEVIPCDACDTTKGWVDLYLLRPPHEGAQKIFVDRKKRKLAKVRLHTDFDVVTRKGELLYRVRWTMSTRTKPRPILGCVSFHVE